MGRLGIVLSESWLSQPVSDSPNPHELRGLLEVTQAPGSPSEDLGTVPLPVHKPLYLFVFPGMKQRLVEA